MPLTGERSYNSGQWFMPLTGERSYNSGGPDMGYTRAQIEAARERQVRAARLRGEAYHDSDSGRRTMQVDAVLFHNARILNERDHGVQNVWNEPEFCKDMAKRHPEIVVKSRPRNTTVMVQGNAANPREFHKKYG